MTFALSEEECRVRPLVAMLDAATTRDTMRRQIAERLHELVKKNETTRRELVACNGIEAVISSMNDNDNRELTLSCIMLLTTLVQHGYAKKVVQYNGTIVLFQLINRILSDDKDLSHSETLVKNVLGLLIGMRPKDPGFCLRCLNADGIGVLLRVIKSNSKCQLKALNLMKMVASHNSCAREIVHSMALLLTYCTVPMGRRNTGQVKVTLQIMTKSIKSSKAMAAKSSPCVATVVELIATWHRYDKKHGGRLLQIRKSLLTLMSAMSTSKECRHKLADLETMRKLFGVCSDMLNSRAPEQLIKQIIAIMNRALPLVSPPYPVVELSKQQQQEKPDEEIVPVLEQFPNLKLFDKFLTESDIFLNRCLGDEKKHIHENLLQLEMAKAQAARKQQQQQQQQHLLPSAQAAHHHHHHHAQSTKKLQLPKLSQSNQSNQRKTTTSKNSIELAHNVSLPSLTKRERDQQNAKDRRLSEKFANTLTIANHDAFTRSQSFTSLAHAQSTSSKPLGAQPLGLSSSHDECVNLTEKKSQLSRDQMGPWQRSMMSNQSSSNTQQKRGRVSTCIVNKNSPRNAFVCSQHKNPLKLQHDIAELAQQTRSISRKDKGAVIVSPNVPSCEIYGQMSLAPAPQPKTKLAQRQRALFENVSRHVSADEFAARLCYVHGDSQIVQQPQEQVGDLIFDANFESGNLYKAYYQRENEYDLWLGADLGMDNQRQWFFFQVRNMTPNVPYKFNILNNEKKESQFGKGMQPLVYSMREAIQGNPAWRRSGKNIVYIKNNYKNRLGKQHFTASFELEFPYAGDTCYLAYHYPYTYTRLRADLRQISVNPSTMIFTRQALCKTLLDNEVDLLTITAPVTRDNPVCTRDYVIISARVHPGETNASWVMKGIIDYLTSETERAAQLRREFIFKLVPMLNPDGCVLGNHRTNYARLDLNRQWEMPTKEKSPPIYYLKGLMTNLVNEGKHIFCYTDLHGHSLKKNGFIFGCEHSTACTELPRLMNTLPMFSRPACRFQLTRERCARVVVYRRLGVLRSYTLETTYNGCDQGQLSNMQVTEAELCELGVGLLSSIYVLKEQLLRDQKDVSLATNDSTATDTYNSDHPFDASEDDDEEDEDDF